MPYLRFTRDTKGFENTYLMHAFRIHGRSQPRVLYWFRTPPGVRVGRAPLDEDAIRTIEESNPDLKFDWKRILQARPEQPPVDPRRRPEAPRRRQRPDARRQEPRRDAQRPPLPQQAQTPRPVEASERPVPGELPESPAPIDVAPLEESVEPQILETASVVSAGLVPEDESDLDAELEAETEGEPPVARSIRTLDPESHARLRARYAEILARISERTSDPVRQEELRAKADRLDPDAWVTADEVRQGLEHYEQIYEELRRVLGRRRRRRRGRRRSGPPVSENPTERN